MATGNRFNSFIEYVNEKAINWASDTFVLALTNSAPSASNTVLADITQISYTNLSSRTLSITASAQTGGTFTATCAQLTMNATGSVGPFRYIVMYDDTATGDPLVQYWDYGSSITLANGESFIFGNAATFTIWTDAPKP